MRRTTLLAIQQAAFGTTFSASGGGPLLVGCLPIGRNAYKGLHSSTKPTHTACMTDGREGIGSLYRAASVASSASINLCCGLLKRYPVAARHLRQAGARPRRFLNDPAFVPLAELPPMTLACSRHDRTSHRRAVSHMTNAMTKGMT
jgi:hypothetical protein